MRYTNYYNFTVSSIELLCNEQFTIKPVLKLPPKDSYNNLVNFESLYGIWSLLVVNELITEPRHVRDKLIFFASSKVSPFL